MEFYTFGKPNNPTLLLLGGEGMDQNALYLPLKKLESSYYLLIPVFAPGESMERRLEGVEECLREHFCSRIWGAYGLDEGGTLLLALLSRGQVCIRTAIVDGAITLPEQPLNPDSPLVYWYGSRDKAAKKQLKLLRESIPMLRTVQLKKLRAGERFLDIRPDLMVKRMKRSFGAAKLVNLSVLLEVNAQQLWELLSLRDHTAAEQLKAPPTITLVPERLLLEIEGQSTLSKHWSHRLYLEPLEENLTLCTHQLELSAGAMAAVSVPRAKALLKKEHKRWRQLLRPAPPRRFPWTRKNPSQ